MQRFTSFFLATTLLLLAANVIADPYVGIGAGVAYYKVDLSSYDAAAGDVKDRGTSTKIYGGYSFNKYYAAELTYYDFAEASVGSVDISDPNDPATPSKFISAATNMKGHGAYAVGMYPVSKHFNLIAKLGLVRWQADLIVNSNVATNSGTDAAYALGMSYALAKELHVTAEWESFNMDNPQVTTLVLGFKAIFR